MLAPAPVRTHAGRPRQLRGTATRIVVRQKSGKSLDLTLTPISGTDYLAFYGFVSDPQRGDTVLFSDRNGKQIGPAWQPYW